MVNARRMSSDSAGPLLKWAGGKRQLLPHLRFYPAEFGRYVEPLLGSGAVFFDLQRSGRLRGREAILIDSNTDLIGCYEIVRDQPDEVGRALDELATAHERGSRDHYYEVRDRRFNPVRERRRRADGRIAYTPARFDAAAQQRLQSMVIALAARGCQILLSNSTAPQITALYDVNRESSAAGLRAFRVRARRAINSNGDKRGPIDEYLITNISEPGQGHAESPA